MAIDDLILVYHSNEEKSVVGVGRVVREAYQDPTSEEDTWSAVDIVPVAPLPDRVALTALRSSPALASMAMLKRTRLSVTPLTPEEFTEIIRLGGTSLPRMLRSR